MRKGHAPFVFSACLVALVAPAPAAAATRGAPLEQRGVQAIRAAAPAGWKRRARASSTVGELERGRRWARGSVGGGAGGIALHVRCPVASRRRLLPTVPRSMPAGQQSLRGGDDLRLPGRRLHLSARRRATAVALWHCQEFPQRDGGYMTCDDGTASGTGCEIRESSAPPGARPAVASAPTRAIANGRASDVLRRFLSQPPGCALPHDTIESCHKGLHPC